MYKQCQAESDACNAGRQARGVHAPLQTLVGRVGGSVLLQLQADLVLRTLRALRILC